MIRSIKQITNVGTFASTHTPPSEQLKRLSLWSASNGAGKSTLAAAIASLDSKTHRAVRPRQGGGAPVIHLGIEGTPKPLKYTNGTWDPHDLTVLVFDEDYVHQNVYVGKDMGSDQRKRLLDVALGAAWVSARLSEDTTRATARDARKKAGETRARIEEMFAVAADANRFIKDGPPKAAKSEFDAARATLALAATAEAIRQLVPFPAVPKPQTSRSRVAAVLSKTVADLDESAHKLALEHAKVLGKSAEQWLVKGAEYWEATKSLGGTCPLCRTTPQNPGLFDQYRAAFGSSVQAHIETIRNELQEASALARLSDTWRVWVEHLRALRRNAQGIAGVPDPAGVIGDPPASIASLSKLLVQSLKRKQASPLSECAFDEDPSGFQSEVDSWESSATKAIASANAAIEKLKASAELAKTKDLADERYLAACERVSGQLKGKTLAGLHNEAVTAESAAQTAESDHEKAKVVAQKVRDTSLPVFHARLSKILSRMCTTFTIARLDPSVAAGVSSATLVLTVPAAPTNPFQIGGRSRAGMTQLDALGDCLSAGDRSTLAFAVFLAEVEAVADPSGIVVVIDDPIGSQDEHRLKATAREVAEIVPKCKQVLLFSHMNPLLFMARKRLARLKSVLSASDVSEHEIFTVGPASEIRWWDRAASEMHAHSKIVRDLEVFRDGAQGAPDDERAWLSCRRAIEGYVHVNYPMLLKIDGTLEQFVSEQQANRSALISADWLVEAGKLASELSPALHFTNPAPEDLSAPSHAEVTLTVRRTLDLIRQTLRAKHEIAAAGGGGDTAGNAAGHNPTDVSLKTDVKKAVPKKAASKKPSNGGSA